MGSGVSTISLDVEKARRIDREIAKLEHRLTVLRCRVMGDPVETTLDMGEVQDEIRRLEAAKTGART